MLLRAEKSEKSVLQGVFISAEVERERREILPFPEESNSRSSSLQGPVCRGREGHVGSPNKW